MLIPDSEALNSRDRTYDRLSLRVQTLGALLPCITARMVIVTVSLMNAIE